MKKKERKILVKKLLVAIQVVLKDNKDYLKRKNTKSVLKSIKKIAKNTDIKVTSMATKKTSTVLKEKPILDGVKK